MSSLKEYKPGTAFSGVIGRTFHQSEPTWPEPLRAKEGAPNVLFIVLDDTGFGQLACYGGSIETPNLDSLAANGLLYNNMHTTALCSPTRTCILIGRNHHSNAMACITEASTGYPDAPVAPFYDTPFEFTGTIQSVTFDVSGDVIKDEGAEMRRIMARQ
jgi:hypothetical protein